jgi:hypothetical protein
MGIDINSGIILFVACVVSYALGVTQDRGKKLDVMQKGTRVRYRGSKDGKWKFGVIEEDIIGKRTLIILRGVELELDEVDQLVVKVSHRIFPIKKESIEILGYDEVWLKKDLV